MRYAVVSKGLSVAQIEALCMKHGGTDIRSAKASGQVFCEMTPDQATALDAESGIVVKYPKKMKHQSVAAPIAVSPDMGIVSGEVLQAMQATVPIDEIFDPLKTSFTPALTGIGLTVAVLDSGVRDTHEMLQGKVVYSEDFTGSGSAADVFDHGTGVAGLLCQIAPGARIMNLRVLGDNGEGEEEDVVMAIEKVIELLEDAQAQELHITDDMYPNAINMSFGAEDDGDEDNPVRVACREANAKFGLGLAAAAGNYGPGPGTITTPAVDPVVVAVGGMVNTEQIWNASSRGPTQEGLVKPDIIFWAENLNVPSCESDTAYKVKSGTSFACPALIGASGLAWEAGRGLVGPNFYMGLEELIPVIPAVCGKPEGAPAEKDNTYGYGTPLPSLLFEQVSPAAGIIDTIMPVMLFAMMGVMMSGMFRR